MTDDQSFNDTDSTSFANAEISLSRTARFWIFLLFDIPSTLCTFFVLFCMLLRRKSRSSIKNHILIILLIFGLASQLIDVPLYIAFILHSEVFPANRFTCLTWWFADIGIYNGGTILMVWVALERHIIIFHDRWLSTTRRRLLVHYLPILVMLLYIFIYYVYAICFFPCENAYDYSLPYCSTSPCFQDDPFMGLWDWIFNTALPAFIEPVFSFAFIFRVIWHKHRSQLPMQWRKQRKMAIQLLSLSLLNLISNFPLGIIGMAHLCGLPANVAVQEQQYFFFMCYFVIFLFPFICLTSVSDVFKRFHRKIFPRQQLNRFTVTVKPKSVRLNTIIQH